MSWRRDGDNSMGEGWPENAREATGQGSQSLPPPPARCLCASVYLSLQGNLDQMASELPKLCLACYSFIQPACLALEPQLSARLQATACTLRPQRQGGVGYKGRCRPSAGTHTPDSTESSQVREGCFQQGNSMCKCRHAKSMLISETRRSPRSLEGKTGAKPAG